jgi:flagellar protein FlgJ
MLNPIASSSTAGTTSPANVGHLRQQAQDLEGIFINTLMKEMFSSLKTDQKSGGGGDAESTWRGIQAEQMSDAISKAGGVGIADAIYADLLAVQEASQSTQSFPGVARS